MGGDCVGVVVGLRAAGAPRTFGSGGTHCRVDIERSKYNNGEGKVVHFERWWAKRGLI